MRALRSLPANRWTKIHQDNTFEKQSRSGPSWYDIYMAQALPVPLGDAAKLIVEQSGGEKTLVDYKIASVSVPGVSRSQVTAEAAKIKSGHS